MLTIARDEEKTPELKRLHGRPRKRFGGEVDIKSEDKILETSFIASDIVLK